MPEQLQIISAMKCRTSELTISSSVTFIKSGAFRSSKIDKINIEGSTEGWDSNWSSEHRGTINYLNS